MKERIQNIHKLSKVPLQDDSAIKRVEIVILKFKEEPKVIDDCVQRIIHHTTWPFKLNIFDNRQNSANTSKVWNKLIRESTCDYVLFIDSDAFVPDKIHPCWLTRMMESIDEKGVVVAVGDNVGGENKASEAKPYPSSSVQTGICSGYCFLIDKKIMKKVGWFDEDFYIYGQDSEFFFRCLKKIGGAIIRWDTFVSHLGSYSFKKAESEGEIDREADKMYAASLYRLKTTGRL